VLGFIYIYISVLFLVYIFMYTHFYYIVWCWVLSYQVAVFSYLKKTIIYFLEWVVRMYLCAFVKFDLCAFASLFRYTFFLILLIIMVIGSFLSGVGSSVSLCYS